MLKALLKKQFSELNAGYFMNRKTGKMRSKGGTVGYIMLFVFIFAMLGMAVFALASSFCKPFCSVGLDWFYFSLMGLIALALSVFGSVFNTYSGLYLAKDNDLLLSMPVKPSQILFVRMTGVFAMGLLYEAIVYIPTLIVWFINGNVSVLSAVYPILMTFVLAVISLVLTCALGFLVALAASRAKNKSVVTVISTLVFLAVYYIIYFNMVDFIKNVVANGESFAEKFKSYAYITYIFGKASAGDTPNMVWAVLIAAALFALTYFVLSKSFVRIVTFKKGDKSAENRKTSELAGSKVSGKSGALLKREFKRFTSCPIYMLNCGIGIIIIIALSVLLIVKSNVILNVVSEIKNLGVFLDIIPVICSAAVCLAGSTLYFTAPSISLEGTRLWIIKSLPVKTEEIFAAKQKMHLILSVIPTVIISAAMIYAFKIEYSSALFMLLTNIAFAQFICALGLMLNLKMPNFDWTNEAVPVKQSAPVTFTLFGGWAISIAMAAVYYFLRKLIPANTYLIVIFVALIVATRFINKYISTAGVKLFSEM